MVEIKPLSALSAAHAANRLMYGARPGDLERIAAMGHEAFVEEQLHPESIDDPEAEGAIAALGHVTHRETDTQLYDRRSASPYSEAVLPIDETIEGTLIRRLLSKRQLAERMAEFWHDHFNVYGHQYIIRSMFSSWDRLIRRNAFGNFKRFLEETAQHPCMLYYLDNYISTDGGPNENYARELFELHALGAENYNQPGGYVDDDVYEAARCFTGWTFETRGDEPDRGLFKYVESDHDRFQKYVLGQPIPRDQPPMKDGLDVIDRLARHEGTARHIARKLAVKFVSDTPPEPLVESAAAVFRANVDSEEQIRLVLRHILNSPEFHASAGAKFKRPADWAASAMRALGIPYVKAENFNFRWIYDNLGQAMFSWRTPDGYTEEQGDWLSSYGMMQRWNFILQIAGGSWEQHGMVIAHADRMPAELVTPEAIADWWAGFVIPVPVSGVTRESLIEFMADGRNPTMALAPGDIANKIPSLAGMCANTPEFMRR